MAIVDNLIAYYRCNDASDSRGTYDGIFRNSAKATSAGRFGAGWDFTADRQNGLVEVDLGSGIPLNGTAGYTVAGWAKDILTTNHTALSSGAWQPYPLFIELNGGSQYLSYRTSGGAALRAQSGGGDVPIVPASWGTDWHHFAVVVDGGVATFYVDGALHGTATDAVIGTDNYYNDLVGNTSFSTGALGAQQDDIAFWSRPLSAAEISEIKGAQIATLIPAVGDVSLGLIGQAYLEETGALQGGATRGTDASRLQVLELNGTTAYLDIGTGYAASLNFNAGDFTLTTWIKMDTLTPPGPTVAYMYLMCTGTEEVGFSGGVSGWDLLIYPDPGGGFGSPKIRFGYQTGGAFQTLDFTGLAFAVSTWTYITLVKSGTTFSLYQDAVLVGELINATGVLSSAGQPLHLGSDTLEGGTVTVQRKLDGLMDDVRIYSRALVIDETITLYNQAGVEPSPTPGGGGSSSQIQGEALQGGIG